MDISWGLRTRILQLPILVFLGLWSWQTSAQISVAPIPKIPVVGDNVLLSVSGDSGPILSFTWHRGETADINQMLYYDSNTEIPSPPYVGRVRGFPNGSMEIFRVNASDSGSYTVRLQTPGGPREATVTITVYALLTPPTLEIPQAPVAEGTNVSLQCQPGSQILDSYIFHKDAENISCAQSNITCDESSPFLHFHPIGKSDSGNYSCTIVNPISNSTSRAEELRVLVRISNVTLSSNVTAAHLWEGEDFAHLTCKALGDEPRFSWNHNGISLPPDPRYHLSASNESLTISPLTRSDASVFTCTVSNSVSQENSNSQTFNISWRPDGRIQCGVELLEEQVMLRCSWPGGSPAADVQLQFQSINDTQQNEVARNVSKDNVTIGNRLTCHGSQINKEDKCTLDFVAPQAPTFSNGSVTPIREGEIVVLEVILDSNSSSLAKAFPSVTLPATFTWIYQTQNIIQSSGRFQIHSGNYSSKLRISPVALEDHGDYVCEATNLVGKTNFSFFVNVTQGPVINPSPELPTSSNEGLSAGAIAGIVIGVLAGLALIGLIVYLILRRKKTTCNKDNTVRSQAASHQPAETVYAQVNQRPGNQVDPNSMALEKQGQGETNYVELKFANQNHTQPAVHASIPETTYSVIKHS